MDSQANRITGPDSRADQAQYGSTHPRPPDFPLRAHRRPTGLREHGQRIHRTT